MPAGKRNRWWEILKTFVRHGFPFIFLKKGYNPRAWERWPPNQQLEFARRVCLLFQDLGPTFVKLGQLLSTRPDLVPRQLAAELSRLQDCVDPLSPAEVRTQVVAAFNKPPEEVFSFFNYQPKASASIGQVHFAILPAGNQVAVKIQRPEIKEIVTKDIYILRKILKCLRRPFFIDRIFNAEEILCSFERIILKELDFRHEAQNVETFRSILAKFPTVVIPRVYWQYSTREILTMQWLDGGKISEFSAALSREQASALAKDLMLALLLPFFQDGLFHGDPHPGNVLLIQDGRLAFLDFGIIGRFCTEFREQAGELLVSLWQGDADKVVEFAQSMGQATARINQEHFYEDMASLVAMVRGMGSESATFGQILQGMIQISLDHGLRMPAPFFLLGKALALGERLAWELDPGFNILSVAEPLAALCLQKKAAVTGNSQNLARKMLAWQDMIWDLPEDLGAVLHQLARGELRFIFHHRNLQWLYEMLEVLSSRLALSMIVAATTIASALTIHSRVGPTFYGFPILGLVGFVVSVMMGVWMAVFFLQKLR